ncbi:acyl-CoA dehydrogenase family protein [Streptomyces sp. NPDC091271]|uniref:acyl-CoA dehydrogenase family protein n=1 Tax=Streptomyces sp. NPDC091271 TaxID=3365980 RepID=UPI003805942C
MDFEPSEEQVMLRDVSRSALKSHATPEQVRAMGGDIFAEDGELWRLGAELGWPGLVLPEEQGGAGQGLAELCVVAEELGRAAAPGPFVPSSLVGLALARGGSAAVCSRILPALADGSASAAWAFAEPGGGCTPDTLTTTAVKDGDAYVLDGRKTSVQDAGAAGWLLVTALLDDRPASFVVEAGTAGVSVRRQQVIDETRAFHEVRLERVRVPADGLQSGGPAGVRALYDAAITLTAADALGAADALLDMTVDYVKVRRQFGRAIGSFQAVKHKCATMLMQVHAARAAVHYAAMAWDAGDPGSSRAASVAKSFASQGMSQVAGEALQTHGGIGFTWEHDLHLLLRRVKTDELLYGGSAEHRERLCALLLADRAEAAPARA